jgi:hypothetical protein
MDTVDHLLHAYKQAPWRTQRQLGSAFLLSVLGSAMIATLYLMVTSQAAIVGREIQGLREKITESERISADLQTNLASLTAKDEMEIRAIAMGFRPIEPNEIEYLLVPGYHTPRGVVMAEEPELKPNLPSIPSEYTQSLLEWLDERLQTSPRGLR